jgi:hypothetical protein
MWVYEEGKGFHLTYYFPDIEVSIWFEYYWNPSSLILVAVSGSAFGFVARMRFPESKVFVKIIFLWRV